MVLQLVYCDLDWSSLAARAASRLSSQPSRATNECVRVSQTINFDPNWSARERGERPVCGRRHAVKNNVR